MNPTMLNLGAALMFGLAAAMFSYVLYRLIGNKRSAALYVGTSMRREEMRTRALRQSMLFRVQLPIISAVARSIQPLELEPLRAYIRVPYVRAGYPGGLEDDEVLAVAFLVGCLVTAFLAFSIIVLADLAWLPLAMLGLPMGLLVTVTTLQSRGKFREIEILKALPYLLDLMVLMLRSGTSLRIALSRVVGDYQSHPIGVEFGQVLAEIDLGSSRVESFRKLSDRLKIQDINAFVESLVQSEELGWPLADTLERLADRLSSERMLRAQAKAGAAGVIVMIPSTLVLASAVLLLFGPFIVKYLRYGSGIS